MQSVYCPECQSPNVKVYSHYETKTNGTRTLFRCQFCQIVFAETANSAMYHIKSPLSKVASVLKVRTEGMGLRATARIFGMSKTTIKDWENRFASLKATLKLYLVCHQFIQLTFEADEVYTRVHSNRPADQSQGWTAIVMERASRFILESQCGFKDRELFLAVMKEVAALVDYTQALSLFSDGERRYSQILFELCSQSLLGQRGRPKKVMPAQVTIRLKNKGHQRNKRGRKRPKYQTPVPHHPLSREVDESEIHANHMEASNGSFRRRNSAYRRRSNTYAKECHGLQRTLDVNWIVHNFARPHFTTGKIPAVVLGVIEKGFSMNELLTMPRLCG